MSRSNAFKVSQYYHTEWMPENELQLRVDRLSMDADFYESLVRQIAMLGGDLSGLVPRCLHERVYRKFRCEEDAGDEH